MEHEHAKLTKLSCPGCGFQVFNRRYARCERCQSNLPVSLLYSDEERRALRNSEAEQLGLELKHRELQGSRRNSHIPQGSTASEMSVFAPVPTGGSGIVEVSGSGSIADSFVSGGGGVFDGGGASGSFGGDSGSSSSSG